MDVGEAAENCIRRDDSWNQRCEACGGRMRVRDVSVTAATLTLRCEDCGRLLFGVPYKKP
jgi:hypothetical protein